MKAVRQVWIHTNQRKYSNELLSLTLEKWHYFIKQYLAIYTHQLLKLSTFLLSKELQKEHWIVIIQYDIRVLPLSN